MFKKLFIWAEDRFAGKLQFQGVYESLNRISIRGMNYRRGHTVGSSGEAHAMRHIRARLRVQGVSKPVVFDVGANIGQFADVLLAEFGTEMDCYCFEPAAKSFEGLVDHFKGSPCIHPFQNGFGKEEGVLELFSNQEQSTIASIYPVYDLQDKTILVLSEHIALRTIDRFCKDKGITHIDFLKIDVEGAELDVLQGAAEMIAQGRIRFVQFEFGPNNMAARAYLKDFFRILKDYRMYRILQNGIRELHYTELLEVPLLSNYLGELKG